MAACNLFLLNTPLSHSPVNRPLFMGDSSKVMHTSLSVALPHVELDAPTRHVVVGTGRSELILPFHVVVVRREWDSSEPQAREQHVHSPVWASFKGLVTVIHSKRKRCTKYAWIEVTPIMDPHPVSRHCLCETQSSIITAEFGSIYSADKKRVAGCGLHKS